MSPTVMTVLELLVVGLLLLVGYALGRGHRQERERKLRRQLTAIQQVVGDPVDVDVVQLVGELAAARDFYAAFHHWWDEHQGSMVAVLDAECAYEQAAGR